MGDHPAWKCKVRFICICDLKTVHRIEILLFDRPDAADTKIHSVIYDPENVSHGAFVFEIVPAQAVERVVALVIPAPDDDRLVCAVESIDDCVKTQR